MASSKYNEIVKTYTKKQLEACKKETLKYFHEHNGECSIKVLSRVGKVPQSYIRKWMDESPTDWVVNPPISDKAKALLESGGEKLGLTEKEQLFCFHYIKTFNHTLSAIRAGYSPREAYQSAFRLLKREDIKTFIGLLRNQRNEDLYLDGLRIVEEYMKIAFADITDFVTFGPDGVTLKSSTKVDGQIITSVSAGQYGPTIKLADKMQALDFLRKYLGIMTDNINVTGELDIKDTTTTPVLTSILKQLQQGGEEDE